jgi:hypothetical protein
MLSGSFSVRLLDSIDLGKQSMGKDKGVLLSKMLYEIKPYRKIAKSKLTINNMAFFISS